MALPTTTIAPLGRLASRALPKPPPRPKGFLTRLFDFLDLPKNVVQNVFGGNIEGAGRNLLDIGTGLTGVRLIPQFNKLLEASREEDRPTLGLVGDILTDPLTYLSFGGVGASKVLAKAGFKGLARGAAKTAGKQLGRGAAGRILSTQLTKAGLKRLGKEASETALKRVAARPGGFLASLLKSEGAGAAQRVARGRVLSRVAPAVLKGNLDEVAKVLGKGALDLGGVKAGLPFLAKKTIGLAGQDPLKLAGKAFLPLALGKQSKTLRDAAAGVMRVLRPLGKAGTVARRVGRRFQTGQAARIREWGALTDDAMKAIATNEPLAKRIGKVALSVNPTDPDGLAKVAANMAAEFAGQPEELAKATEALGKWREMSTRMLAEMKDMGTLKGSSIPSELYMSLQWTDEFAEKMNDVARAAGPGGSSPKTVFEQARKYMDPAEFVKEFGEEALETDIRKLILKRTNSHARSMAKGQLIRQSNTLVSRGVKAGIGKGGPLSLNTLTDSVLEEWIKSGAGKLKPRGKTMQILSDYNRMFFKGQVTVGIGPIPNVAFVTRNAVSGIFQALTDEQIGLAGFKHIPILLDGLMAKVGKAFGWKHHGVVNKLVHGATEGVEFAGRTGDDLLKSWHRVSGERAFTAAEFAPELGVSGKGLFARGERFLKKPGLQKFNYSRQATEYTEEAMRMNAWLTLVGKGVDDAEAAQKVAAAFIDYRVASEGERLLRDVVPFAKFTVEQTPRTIESVLRRPILSQPFRALAGGRDPEQGPLPSFLEGRPTISLGEGSPGVEQVLAQFGTPVEDLSRLGTGEGVARTIEQGGFGAVTPLLKGPAQAVLNRDFFRGRPLSDQTRAPSFLPDPAVEALGGKIEQTPFGERRRIPSAINQVFNNLPVTRQLRQLDKLMSDRQPVWVKTLDLITGAKIYDVDKDREIRRQIRDYLQQKAAAGDIGTVNRFFAKGDTDPELTQIIKQFYSVGSGKKGR